MTPSIVRHLRALATTAAGLFVVAGMLRDPLVADHPVRGVDWYLTKSRVVVRADRAPEPVKAPQATVQNVVPTAPPRP